MPKQMIHEGRTYSLIPLREPDGKVARDEEGNVTSHWYRPGFADRMEVAPYLEGLEPGDYMLNDHEPHASISWSKGRAEPDGYSGGIDEGFVQLHLEVSPEWMRRKVQEYDLQLAASRKGEGVFAPEANIQVTSGPLSWKDLNVLARTARDARDGAFGKPE